MLSSLFFFFFFIIRSRQFYVTVYEIREILNFFIDIKNTRFNQWVLRHHRDSQHSKNGCCVSPKQRSVVVRQINLRTWINSEIQPLINTPVAINCFVEHCIIKDSIRKYCQTKIHPVNRLAAKILPDNSTRGLRRNLSRKSLESLL